MSGAREVMSSAYMNWAKTKSGAKFNLAMSGIPNVKLSELRVSLEDLEITDGGYGYKPLLERIGAAPAPGISPEDAAAAVPAMRTGEEKR